MKETGTRRSVPVRPRVRRSVAAAAAFAALTATLIATGGPAGAATFVNWTTYLYSGSHSSLSPATTVTPSNAAGAKRLWNWRCPAPTISGQPPTGFIASPTVYNGVIYIGCNTGVFYAISEAAPTVLWSRMLGYVTHHTCAARGVSDTATVASDPNTGKPTVYVASGDGKMFALDAATGNIVWQTVMWTASSTTNDYYQWSSPVLAGGHLYIGISSQCDKPFIPGGAQEYDQATGDLLGTYIASIPGFPGAGVWTSPAVGADGSVYVTTASGSKTQPGDAFSIVQLADHGSGITKQSIWTIPIAQQVGDSDFGGSPTIFTANLGGTMTEMVGACNKNGIYYAWRTHNLAAGPVWTYQIGVGTPKGVSACLGAASWDGTHLFVPGNATTINGTAYNGSLRELNPATGGPLWQTGLPGIVLGSPSMDAGGIVAAPTYGPTTTNGVYLVNASNGAVVKLVGVGKEFAQPVFADTYLVLATNGGGLNVFHV